MKTDNFTNLSIDSENLEKNWNTLNEPIKVLGKEKIKSLKKVVEEIEELIEEREDLSDELVKEGEKIKTEITNFILETDSIIPKDNTEREKVMKQKNDLRQKKVDISELQLNEKINCWKDIALLKKELRDREKELQEREDRADMISGILGEN